MITILCPTYNEINYISDLIGKLQKMPPHSKELIFMDGMSSDGTTEFLREAEQKYDNFYIIDNPERYVPFALNRGIKIAKGEVIVRIDAHSLYSENYFTSILDTFNRTGADIVGGAMRVKIGTDFQQAVGYVTSTSLGIGNSNFHFANFEGFTDSVYLGAWKRQIFETTGLFDESLKRNQDDEFHYRAGKHGFKIYQSPSIVSFYFPRDNIKALFKQYYQYGLYKPMVIKKITSGFSLRHIVPASFVLYLVCLSFLGVLSGWFFIPLVIYVALVIYYSFLCQGSAVTKLFSFLIYPTLHVSYGLGFLLGLTKSSK